MKLTNTLLGLATLAATTANSQTGTKIRVAVGEGGILRYSPNNITAKVGTAIEFSFFPKNHSVVQSSFDNPCHPLAGGFFSSFVSTKDSPSGTSFTVVVNDTKPIWFYCSQTSSSHCQSGMVGAINAPASGNTLDAFIALAENATASTSPPGSAIGGVLKVDYNSTITPAPSLGAAATLATSSITAVFIAGTILLTHFSSI